MQTIKHRYKFNSAYLAKLVRGTSVDYAWCTLVEQDIRRKTHVIYQTQNVEINDLFTHALNIFLLGKKYKTLPKLYAGFIVCNRSL